MTHTTPTPIFPLFTPHAVHGTTACYPGISFKQAVQKLPHAQESFGALSVQHVQLCPQSLGILNIELAAQLKNQFPVTQFRLHANTRRGAKIELFDASCDIRESCWLDYVTHMKSVNQVFNAPFWSIHAGRKNNVTLQDMYDNLSRIQDFMQSPVGIEGLYPSHRTNWNLTSFEDYAGIIKQNVFFALDLSHIQITAAQLAQHSALEWEHLIIELMEHKNCYEIHISDNNSLDDTHKPLSGEPWWWSAFNRSKIAAHCVVFSEGNQNFKNRHTMRLV